MPLREVKTVNAWFQNKRASCKKRNNKAAGSHNSAASNQFELPPISQLIASVSPNDYDDSEDDRSFADRLPPISSASSSASQPRPPRSRPLAPRASVERHQTCYAPFCPLLLAVCRLRPRLAVSGLLTGAVGGGVTAALSAHVAGRMASLCGEATGIPRIDVYAVRTIPSRIGDWCRICVSMRYCARRS